MSEVCLANTYLAYIYWNIVINMWFDFYTYKLDLIWSLYCINELNLYTFKILIINEAFFVNKELAFIYWKANYLV